MEKSWKCVFLNFCGNLVSLQITLERSDGVKANIMKFGNYLRQTLEEKTDDQLHRFHKPHR